MFPRVSARRRHILRNPQAVAWAVLLAAFISFCLLAVLGSLGLRWFLFDSQLDMALSLTASRGRVDMTMPDGTSANITASAYINAGAALQVDDGSQAYLTFEDNYSREVVARVLGDAVGQDGLPESMSRAQHHPWRSGGLHPASDSGII